MAGLAFYSPSPSLALGKAVRPLLRPQAELIPAGERGAGGRRAFASDRRGAPRTPQGQTDGLSPQRWLRLPRPARGHGLGFQVPKVRESGKGDTL